jgi:hypothetical protein
MARLMFSLELAGYDVLQMQSDFGLATGLKLQ